jgi:hypothetical protein
MSKFLDIGVEKDHIESITKAGGLPALSELIWNSLDADASEIKIEYKKNGLEGFEYIKVIDNGHGLTYEKAQKVFSKLGGSEKKTVIQSPSGRRYHGKEGKGRYKSLSLGDSVKFVSVFESDNIKSTFDIVIDRNQLSKTQISDLKSLKKGEGQTGFLVEIFNINNKNANLALDNQYRKELEEKFTSYWLSYPKFKIFFNGNELDFLSMIKNKIENVIPVEDNGVKHIFRIKILEWNFDNKKKTYLCNLDGIPFIETSVGIRTSIPLSVFIQSDYIEKLQRDNTLEFYENNELVKGILKETKEFTRDYVRTRLHENSKEYIQELKQKGLYPYKDKADNLIEETKRQVFDIVALNLHEYLPSFSEQDDKNIKLTLNLVSESLNNDSKTLRRILTEVIELPEAKREELVELLDGTSLSNIIDTMTEIKNRLNFLNGLEQIIYENELNKNFKERKHLHKIIINETWIFGDEYTYGVDDVSLKTVLKTYLKECLQREDLEEIMDSEDNEELNTIPDVCLWKQFSLGKAGFENLVIELKKPSKNAGFIEKSQIEQYASKVANDKRFSFNKTKWNFILITKNVTKDVAPLMKQPNRKYGHIFEGENYNIFILTWGEIISEAKIRLNYIKERLNINLKDNDEGLNYIKARYKEYLPENLKD